MRISRLQRDIKVARDTLEVDELKLPPAMRSRLAEARRRLGEVLEYVAELRNDMFELQEQNQQLRRDLTDKVCPRLCNLPHRSAT